MSATQPSWEIFIKPYHALLKLHHSLLDRSSNSDLQMSVFLILHTSFILMAEHLHFLTTCFMDVLERIGQTSTSVFRELVFVLLFTNMILLDKL